MYLGLCSLSANAHGQSNFILESKLKSQVLHDVTIIIFGIYPFVLVVIALNLACLNGTLIASDNLHKYARCQLKRIHQW